MMSVMSIGSEVFGRCVGEINVSVEIENRGVWLCYGWKYMSLFVEGKWLKIGDGSG